MRRTHTLRLLAATLFGLAGATMAQAQAPEDLAPYKMLRSLQFVQDSVVGGDHAAAEMQKFMLASLDRRLRTAGSDVFEDPRNVDAALIYAMSGGNPATLEFLVGKDVEGYFDNRVADALRKYLGGKAALVAKPLAEMMPEYRDSRIGPYLALVSASAALPGDPKAALGFYDFARLAAPGTNVEEAALRRSLAIAAGSGMVEAGLGYANRYARRFLHSPYASQFADLFVMLAVDNYGEVADADIEGILASMDNDRKRETYLRIARKAAIVGKSELARMASARAEEIPLAPGLKSIGEVDLYSGLANLASPEVGRIVNDLVGISDEKLSQRDQALRAAAKFVGDEVLRKPDPNSLAQVDAATTPGEGPATADSQTAHAGQPKVDEKSVAQAEDANAGIDEFVSKGRSKLAQIDSLLQEGK
ncbi:chemotaxis protein MotC [Rhizobium sp. YJ-22]|uniref:chemotaxis protein MotC n=1 Tax=Rhizobium sp. YJ-22 TaxID=3037556 RepID=UPI0024124A9C|nr:chemotaxis protein MotC [Rhizobium sp. YJ-22]MDG3575199.1 chemotaxis protein MotC [Rhizobium sp. YJ-22]